MRENRLYGSEGGVAEGPFRPLSAPPRRPAACPRDRAPVKAQNQNGASPFQSQP